MSDPAETVTTTDVAPTNILATTGAPSPSEVLIPPSQAAPIRPDLKDGKAVIIVGNHRVPKDVGLVIVVEGRDYVLDEDGEVVSVKLKTGDYPGGAQLYLRTDYSVEFPRDAKVITLGEDVLQGNFSGFTPNPQFVHVGPAHPAYAAANLAWQRGANVIEIVGLTKKEQAHLQPWFDRLATDPLAPAAVSVSFT